MKTLFNKIVIAAVAAMFIASCTPHAQLWQRRGHMEIDAKGVYHFKPYEAWHPYTAQRPLPDTLFQFVNAYHKPKN